MSSSPLPSYLPRPFWISGLCLLVILAYAATLVSEFYVPLLWDDIWYSILGARAGRDGWVVMQTFPQCNASLLIPIPVSLLPGRTFSWLMHEVELHLWVMRSLNIALLLTWISYTTWLIRHLLWPRLPVLFSVAAIIAVSSLGTTPYAMLMNRPETAILLAVTFYASMPLVVERHPHMPRLGIAMLSVAYMLVTSWLISSHPKALFYTPLLLLAGIWTGRWNKKIAAMLVVAACTMLFQSWQSFWQLKLACPGSGNAADNLAHQALSLSLFLADKNEFWRGFVTNLSNVQEYLSGAVWFEDELVSPSAASKLYTTLLPLVHLLFWPLLAWVIGLFIAIWPNIFSVATWKHPALPTSFCLLAAALLQMGFQSEKKFYNFSLLWMSLLLAGCLMQAWILSKPKADRWRTLLGYGYPILLGISLFSQCVMLSIYTPMFVTLAANAPESGIIHYPKRTMSPLHEAQTQALVKRAADGCGIAPGRASEHIIIDIYTYTSLKNTYQPMNMTFDFHEFDDPTTFFAFVRPWHPAGLVTACATLPGKLKPWATKYGPYCCMTREQMDAFPLKKGAD